MALVHKASGAERFCPPSWLRGPSSEGHSGGVRLQGCLLGALVSWAWSVLTLQGRPCLSALGLLCGWRGHALSLREPEACRLCSPSYPLPQHLPPGELPGAWLAPCSHPSPALAFCGGRLWWATRSPFLLRLLAPHARTAFTHAHTHAQVTPCSLQSGAPGGSSCPFLQLSPHRASSQNPLAGNPKFSPQSVPPRRAAGGLAPTGPVFPSAALPSLLSSPGTLTRNPHLHLLPP